MDPNQAILLLACLLVLAAAGYYVLRIIERSLESDTPSSLIGVLSMIVVLGIVGYLGFGEERTELIALASTALGALTATLTGMNARRPPPPKDEDEDDE